MVQGFLDQVNQIIFQLFSRHDFIQACIYIYIVQALNSQRPTWLPGNDTTVYVHFIAC